ncbi:hypothetical protein HY486_00275 [Candidatus Woesearchaeota archaeon]|nr:hypothetical protein [Candidatus Woesearchaeota archaeon]
MRETEQKPKDDEGKKQTEPGEDSRPYVLKIKPGTAAEKSMKILVPEELRTANIDRILAYAKGLTQEEGGLKREDVQIQERLATEMAGKYGITADGEAVDGKTTIDTFFKEVDTPNGTKVMVAEIIVAARQEGAKNIEYCLGQ